MERRDSGVVGAAAGGSPDGTPMHRISGSAEPRDANSAETTGCARAPFTIIGRPPEHDRGKQVA